jgi:TolB-like protein
MNKSVILSVVLLFIPVFVFAQNALTLDAALNNSTAYLNGRIPPKSKVVVLNFTSNWPQLSEYIIEELIGYIVNEGTLTVVDRRNLEVIRQEMDFQLSGEVNDETAQSIGQKLGAQTIISGAITAIGNTYRLRIRAIAVETAQIQGMQNVDVIQDSRLAALTGTAYVGPTAPPSITTTKNTAPSTNLNILPNVGWYPNSDGVSTTKINITREYIEGQEEVRAVYVKY